MTVSSSRTDDAPPTFWELAEQATSSTRRGYDLLAQRFEATPYCTPESWVLAATRRVDEKYGSSSNNLAADLCSGTGVGARALGRSGLTVDCYDFSTSMLSEAQKRWPFDPERLRLHELDLSESRLPRGRYGRMASFGAWGHILPAWRESFFQELMSALAPGGVFFTIVAEPISCWSKRAVWSTAFDMAIKLRNRLLAEPFHMYYRLNDSVTLERLFTKLAGSNFEISLEPVPGSPHLELSLLMIRRSF